MRISSPARVHQSVKILTFNIWGGGGKPLEETIDVIRKTSADIIGLQEVYHPGHAEKDAAQPTLTPEIAQALGFHYHDQRRSAFSHGVTAVLSRFPITGHTRSGLGVRIDVHGSELTVFNIHLQDAPYQPYQLAGISYADAPFLRTAEEAIASAHAARGGTLNRLEKDLFELNDSAVLIMGDFNEPSHRDWTLRAASIRRHPIAVEWPTTKRIESWGFVDAYRHSFPDEIAHPGFSWTVHSAPDEHHDRIDFIYLRGSNVSVESCLVVGEKSPEAHLIVTPWPSDHRAMLSTIKVGARTLSMPSR